MSGRFAPYPSYEQSAADWHDEVPTGWKTLAIGRLFRRDKRTGFEDEELLSVYRDYGVIPKSSRDDNHNNASEDLSPYQLVDVGDLVLNKMKAWQGSIAVSEHRGIVSPAYFVYRRFREDESRIVLRYVHYLLRSSAYITQYLRQSKGIRVSQWDLDPKAFERIEALLPTPEEQTQIAAFLDHETAKIDALIARQQELIALLKEKRQAVISHAVTRGLNPDVKLRDSGVEWLGQVPEHWEVGKLGRLVFMQEGPGLRTWQFKDDGVRVICVTNITDAGIDFTRLQKFISKAEYLQTYRHFTVQPGDILLSSSGNSWGKVAVYKESAVVILNTSTIRVNELKAQPMMRDFIRRYLESVPCREQLDVAMTGSCQPNFGPTHLSRIKVVVPPRNEQLQICEYINRACESYDSPIQSCADAIELLAERRSALISAAVTGKIDVRQWDRSAAGAAS